MRRLALSLAFVCAAPIDAAADMVPDGKALVTRTYSVENAGEFPEHLIVGYPWFCDWDTREPPGVGSREAEGVPYDVVTPGTEHTYIPMCRESRIYVVDRAGLTVGPLVRTIDDVELPIDVAELTALRGEELAAFFRADPRVHPTGHVIDPPRELVDASTPLRKVHTVLRLERAGDAFSLRGARVRYTYEDDGVEELAYTSSGPPPPSGHGTPLPPAPLRMSSEIPRWPFIAGAFGVFLIMAAFGLRRRRS